MKSVLVELTEAEIATAMRVGDQAPYNPYPNKERGYQIAKAFIAKAKAMAASSGLKYEGLDYRSGCDADGKWAYALMR